MRTLFSSLTLGLLTTTLTTTLALSGCGQDSAIDFSEVAIADENEKADVIIPGQGYTWVRPSDTQIACVRAPCPNAILNDVNLGQSQLSYAFDWRALRLTPSKQAELEASTGKLLLYGRYATAKLNGEAVRIYQVTRANPTVSLQSRDNAEADRYFMVKAVDPACQQPPCVYSALVMNLPQREQWADINLSRLGLPQNALQKVRGELATGSAYLSILDSDQHPVVATQVFRPYTAAPLPND